MSVTEITMRGNEMRVAYGVPCDRSDCGRVVAVVDAHCCHRCAESGEHTEACDRRQESFARCQPE